MIAKAGQMGVGEINPTARIMAAKEVAKAVNIQKVTDIEVLINFRGILPKLTANQAAPITVTGAIKAKIMFEISFWSTFNSPK